MLNTKAVSLIACPKCHADLSFAGDTGSCAVCGSGVPVRDGVIVARELSASSYFDNVFEVMRLGNREQGTWEIFYRQQAEFVSESLRDGDIVVDVGCGPELPYRKRGAFVVGVDASFESIRANTAVDLRLFASASALPMKDASADTIVCFYSIHHMTGETVAYNRSNVQQVFREFARVLKPAGRLLIFDVSPRWPFGTVEELSWNLARRWLGPSLDMYFWQKRKLEQLGRAAFANAAFKLRRFAGSPMTTFPPIFSKPSLRLPRILYPFDICLYEWQQPGG